MTTPTNTTGSLRIAPEVSARATALTAAATDVLCDVAFWCRAFTPADVQARLAALRGLLPGALADYDQAAADHRLAHENEFADGYGGWTKRREVTEAAHQDVLRCIRRCREINDGIASCENYLEASEAGTPEEPDPEAEEWQRHAEAGWR